MDPAYYVAAGSLKARSIQLDGLSNNLANLNTVGYKPEKTFFSVFNKAQAEGRGLPLSRYVNDGTVLANQGTDFTQGPTRSTGNPLDLALEGKGFFALQTPEGVRLTRDGRFTLDTKGQLVAQDGSPALGKNGRPIVVNPSAGKISIGMDGTLQQAGASVGQLDVRNVQNPQMMTRGAMGRFDPAGAQPAAPTAKVLEGHLEESGMDMASAMVDMIRLNRLFEMSMKVASTLSNDLDTRSINDIANSR